MILAAVEGGNKKYPLYLNFNRETINSKVFQKILHSKILY